MTVTRPLQDRELDDYLFRDAMERADYYNATSKEQAWHSYEVEEWYTTMWNQGSRHIRLPSNAQIARQIMDWFRSRTMQRTFTLEIRVDYADNGKNEEMRKVFSKLARHGIATATLLSDGVKPTAAIFSDDFFSGHEHIELLDDVIAQGVEEIGGDEGEGVSSELLNALK